MLTAPFTCRFELLDFYPGKTRRQEAARGPNWAEWGHSGVLHLSKPKSISYRLITIGLSQIATLRDANCCNFSPNVAEIWCSQLPKTTGDKPLWFWVN